MSERQVLWFLPTVSGDSPSWKWTLGKSSAIIAGRREKKMWAE
jgi:hypothetical protein